MARDSRKSTFVRLVGMGSVFWREITLNCGSLICTVTVRHLRCCARNRLRFCERWEEFLSKATYESWDDMRQGYRFTKPRLLYIDAEYPQPDRGSGGLDAIFFMDYYLKRGYDIAFHGEYTPGYNPKYTAILLRMGE